MHVNVTGKRYKICYLWSKLWTIRCQYSYNMVWKDSKKRNFYFMLTWSYSVMEFHILMVSIILGFILFPNIALAQLTQQQLEVVKLQREIELLNQQIKNSSSVLSNILYTLIIPILVVRSWSYCVFCMAAWEKNPSVCWTGTDFWEYSKTMAFSELFMSLDLVVMT
jgi:hypothetical protein